MPTSLRRLQQVKNLAKGLSWQKIDICSAFEMSCPPTGNCQACIERASIFDKVFTFCPSYFQPPFGGDTVNHILLPLADFSVVEPPPRSNCTISLSVIYPLDQSECSEKVCPAQFQNRRNDNCFHCQFTALVNQNDGVPTAYELYIKTPRSIIVSVPEKLASMFSP